MDQRFLLPRFLNPMSFVKDYIPKSGSMLVWKSIFRRNFFYGELDMVLKLLGLCYNVQMGKKGVFGNRIEVVPF